MIIAIILHNITFKGDDLGNAIVADVLILVGDNDCLAVILALDNFSLIDELFVQVLPFKWSLCLWLSIINYRC